MANAGLSAVDIRNASADGYELTFAVNYLAHVQLIDGLLDSGSPSSRSPPGRPRTHHAVHATALDRPLALQCESELDEERRRGREVVDHDARVLHALGRHALDGSDSTAPSYSVSRLPIGWWERAAHRSEETSDELLGSIGSQLGYASLWRTFSGATVPT